MKALSHPMPLLSSFPSLRSMAAAWFSGGKAEDGNGSGTKGGGKKGSGKKGSSTTEGGLEGIPDGLKAQAGRWADLWGLPGMTESVTVEFSRRFRSALGNCRPVQGRIRLAAHLETENEDLLEEVLCHELAHVAVYRLHGRRARPHGPEWKGLISAAGFKPQARFQREEGRFPPRSPKPRARWEHRCPVCGAQRTAGRPVRNWRCAKCRRDGLSGELVITRVPAGARPPSRDGSRRSS